MDRFKERLRMGLEDVEMFASIDQSQLDAMADALLAAKRIFVAGWGRAGNCIRILSMDCSQIGLETFVVGDNSTPSIQPDDILVIGSGSGETKTMAILARQCKEHGAKLGLVSGNPDSTIGKLADVNVVIPKKSWAEDAPPASGGSLYHVMVMVCDILRVYLADKLGVTNADIVYNHNNLE
ncbi:MAG: SIS domain-containing protein [Christensenellaceae bacterium]|jgi:6-phospho-3-hexuloisomerase